MKREWFIEYYSDSRHVWSRYTEDGWSASAKDPRSAETVCGESLILFSLAGALKEIRWWKDEEDFDTVLPYRAINIQSGQAIMV